MVYVTFVVGTLMEILLCSKILYNCFIPLSFSVSRLFQLKKLNKSWSKQASKQVQARKALFSNFIYDIIKLTLAFYASYMAQMWKERCIVLVVYIQALSQQGSFNLDLAHIDKYQIDLTPSSPAKTDLRHTE